MLVVTEVALSLVLLVSASLLVRSHAQLISVAPGFNAAGAMTASVLLPIAGGFDQQRDGPGWATFFAEYERRLEEDASVEAAGGISSQPLSGASESTSYVVDGAPAIPDGAPRPSADYQVVTTGWFEAAEVPLLAGRAFDSRDGLDAAPAILVSEGLARAHWPGVPLPEVIGRRLSTGLVRQPQTIIGIVGDIRQGGLDTPARPSIYMVESQYPYPFLSFVVRLRDKSADPATALPAMRRALQAIDPSLALDDVKSFQAVLDASVAKQRFGMVVTGVFAIAALLLATVGLYGVIATGIAQRRREIGVRMALGATTNNVLGEMMKEGARLTLAGVVIGIAGSFAATRLFRDQLFGVSATDSAVYGAVAVVTAAVAMAATMVPAWRATRVDVAGALRVD
jgi:predicted permease